MKILYAIQGTGNGHLSRAVDIVPCLEQHGSVDILVSGIQGDLSLPYPVKYKHCGMGFIFGKSGGVDLWKTFAKSKPRKLLKDIQGLPVENYDLVINDFEPVSAWACFFKNKPCISLSHQSAVLDSLFPQPESTDKLGRLILQNYAPSDFKYGFHFSGNGDNIFTPVIRRQVRNLEVTNAGHYTVYLPSYDDQKLIKAFSEYPDVQWDIFSKHNSKKIILDNITIQPVNNSNFTASMAAAAGVLCGAGFETPAEALHMGKKLLVIPMKNQYEQQLNAAALAAMDIPVIKSMKPKHFPVVSEWLERGKPIAVDYPEMTNDIIAKIVARHGNDN